MDIRLVTRTDDFGSARSANEAILEAVGKGCFVRNVSCMAVGPFIEEGAELLKHCPNICLGVHLTLNSEWDGIVWKPLSQGALEAGLMDGRGCFHKTQMELVNANPEGILREYDAQLDRLTRLGLRIEYADSHMIPELFVPGLPEALQEWVRRKGLIDAGKYYRMEEGEPLPGLNGEPEGDYLQVKKWKESLEDGEQYLYVVHPAKAGDEMLRFYNEFYPAGEIQAQRDREYRTICADVWQTRAEELGLVFLRYSEAEEQGDGIEWLKAFEK